MNFHKKIITELGDPPWDEDTLKRSYFQNFSNTYEVVRSKHPGAPIYTALESIRLSHDVFQNSVEDLIASINKFKGESSRIGFWNRPSRQLFDELVLSIQRGVVSSAMCAMALVDHTRDFVKEFEVSDYEDKIEKEFRNDQQHKFVHSLRRYITHVKITKAHWNIKHAKEGRSVFFLLSQADLLEWSSWDSLAKDYIISCKEEINIEDLFGQYSLKVLNLHNWLRSAIMDRYGVQVAEYMRYQKMMNRFSSESQWNTLLAQVLVPQNIDPYMYLDRYLTKSELDNVLSLPHRSKEQVDKIISIIDEYDACTNDIRGLVYKLFKIEE